MILRNRAKLDWSIEHTAAEADTNPRTRVITDLVLRDGLNESDIAALFGSTEYAPPALTPEECTLIGKLEGQTLDQPAQPSWVKHAFPAWLEEPLSKCFGDRLETEMSALNEPAPVDLRVNTLKATRGDVMGLLAANDMPNERSKLSPVGLRLQGHPRVTHTQFYKDGLVEVQDEGSQLASLLVDARAGMTVIDLCAGAGGKTLAIVNAMIDGGRFDGMVWACDISEPRLRELEKRAVRNGVMEAVFTHVLTDNDVWLGDNEGLADRVLCDVPCSGSGAWRREPENRWRLTPGSLSDYISRQRDILGKASGLVKPGGRLIYVTCSILPAENEEQADWFLEHHPEFSLIPADDVWRHVFDTAPPAQGETLRLSPASSQTDGFFIAIFEKH